MLPKSPQITKYSVKSAYITDMECSYESENSMVLELSFAPGNGNSYCTSKMVLAGGKWQRVRDVNKRSDDRN